MTRLVTAREINAFSAGKVIASVAEPMADHTRFTFTDGSALVVVLVGAEPDYSEYTPGEPAYVSYYGEPTPPGWEP